MKLALFDLDHTLLAIDTNDAWRSFEAKLGWGNAAQRHRQFIEYFDQYNEGKLDIAEYVNFATELVRQRGAEEFAAVTERFVDEMIRPNLYPQAVELIEQHRQANDQLIIITATNEIFTRPIATALGVEELIAIKMKRDPISGWISGEIQGEPSFREGKVNRLEQWLQQRGLNWQDVRHSTFYSDSINDLALLEKVNQPVAVNPDQALRNIAVQRNWPIKDIFTKK